MTISNEAIEAGGRAICLMEYGVEWEHMGETGRDSCRREASVTLPAAASAIQAAALRDAAGEADDRAEAAHKVSQNRAAHDFPTRVRYAAYAEEARCIAHVLRARAATIEGESHE